MTLVMHLAIKMWLFLVSGVFWSVRDSACAVCIEPGCVQVVGRVVLGEHRPAQHRRHAATRILLGPHLSALCRHLIHVYVNRSEWRMREVFFAAAVFPPSSSSS